MQLTQQRDAVYADIAKRTGGSISMGIVGPVRTGKSTFIKKMMEKTVLPAMPEGYEKEKARDELPQSAAGKTVMTTEPKFIPEGGAEVTLDGYAGIRMKLVDCVGYVVPGALGQSEDGEPRMVRTPWSEAPMPFAEAAELGTRKVITDHSTMALLVTTDGSICEIPREEYLAAEKAVAAELRKSGVPFAVVLNSAHPGEDEAVRLAYELEEAYGAPVALVNCLQLEEEDLRQILGLLLREFPVRELRVALPPWTAALDAGHPLLRSLEESLRSAAAGIRHLGDLESALSAAAENEAVTAVRTLTQDPSTGGVKAEVSLRPALYYEVISALTGLSVESDRQLVALLRELAETKRKYDKVAEALESVEREGYGIVMPGKEELRLEQPEIVKMPGGYGVKLRASAPSIHMIRADIETELSPVVGTEAQSEELVKYLLDGFKDDPSELWETHLFGRSLHELVQDGLLQKLDNMPGETRAKLSETLARLINEGASGLVCILL